ncbi:MAG: VOC family protein [Betaproteobacteria bacterium]|nr:VOC family protein [Betaproteobacteria bacterium]MDH4326678.1 VOC family protein [Betaproteobacteria bacterium]MDH5212564.1 VOC family protein [Betaproteobacteria bacterium]MDH5576978.1 VOC family protein [Betaproteobacteria bacterium]
MPVKWMDHFNIITDDLPATLAFYEEHLNLKPGARPPFKFPGAWLYADGGKGKDPILHVVAGKDRKLLVKGVIDHMAFYGTGLAATVAKLKAKGIDYELRRLPEYGTWQLFFHDPNNAKVEIDFDAREPEPA